MNFGIKAMSLRETVVLVYTVAGLLMLDVFIRALIGGYDASEIGGADIVTSITLTIFLFNNTRLGSFARG